MRKEMSNVKKKKVGFTSRQTKRVSSFSLCSFPFVVYCHQPNTVSNFESLAIIHFLMHVSTLPYSIELRDGNELKTVLSDDISSIRCFSHS